jgi:uncharacterized protein YndB with AHSA1/START domain
MRNPKQYSEPEETNGGGTMSPIKVQDDKIVQEVAIKAPAERIFRSLTKPDEMLKWWCAAGKFKLTHAECDLQAGGKWRMRVAGAGTDEPSSSTVYGQYQTIEPPHVLSYTWIRENEDLPEKLVRWDLDEKDGYTTVRVTHSGLITESLRARNSGWLLIVTLLEAYMDQQE